MSAAQRQRALHAPVTRRAAAIPIWSRCRRAARRTPRSRRVATSSASSRLVTPGEPLKSVLLIEPAGRRGRRQPLARRRQALAVAGQSRMADARGLGAHASAARHRRRRRRGRCRARSGSRAPRSSTTKSSGRKVQPILMSAAQGQRTLHVLSRDGRRQFVPRAAAAGEHDLHRRADAAQFRARLAAGHAGRTAEEHPAR